MVGTRLVVARRKKSIWDEGHLLTIIQRVKEASLKSDEIALFAVVVVVCM